MLQTIIFHIDVNSAYLSWEAIHRCHIEGEELDLREIPSVVGGDMSKRHGVVLAKSLPAKQYGIKTGEPLQQAFLKCPFLVSVPPRHRLYEQYSNQLMSILKQYSPIVEQTSIDEAFLEMGGMFQEQIEAIQVAHDLKERIKKELGFTVNIGISVNKLLAKMASDLKKPDYIHTLFPNEIPQKMWPLPVRKLYGIGQSTEKKLIALGIKTIKDIACSNPDVLRSHFKKQGETIYQHANGVSSSYMSQDQPLNKGYGNSITLSSDVIDYAAAELVLISLCETVGFHLRSSHVTASVICVELTDCHFKHSSHQMTLLSPTNLTIELQQASFSLFRELWDAHTPIRLLGVRATKLLEEDTRQLSLFDYKKHDKLSKLDNAIDQIRNKYGKEAIKRAAFLESPSSKPPEDAFNKLPPH